MTDEERRKLCSSLRDPGDNPFTFQVEMLMQQAANEIERLAESLRAAHRYAEECEAKIQMQADQIDRMITARLRTTKMTDEERQKLLLDLRRQSTDDLFGKAADEIKRLAAELKQVEREHHIQEI